MTRRLHRFLVLAAFALLVGAGLRLVCSDATFADETTSSTRCGDLIAVANHTGSALATVRLRTPISCAVASCPLWEIGSDPLLRRSTRDSSEPHASTRLYARLRVFRI